jgi:ribosomal-protein-serine acetyltransferase
VSAGGIAETGGRTGFRYTVAPGIELKLFAPEDAAVVYAAADRDRAYLRRWLPWVDRTHHAADVLHFIVNTVGPQWEEGRGPQCGIWVDGVFRGSVGCHPIDWANRSCSIGYWVASEQQGRGLVTRCCTAMIDYLIEELHLHRVVIQCGTENQRSCAVPERLGFTREGVLRGAEWVNDRWVDLVTWSMLEDEWRARMNGDKWGKAR